MTFLLLNNFVSEACLLACVWPRSNINKARGELVPVDYCVHSSTMAIYRETFVSLTAIAVAVCIVLWFILTCTQYCRHDSPFHNDPLTMKCIDLERSSHGVIVKISSRLRRLRKTTRNSGWPMHRRIRKLGISEVRSARKRMVRFRQQEFRKWYRHLEN